MGRQRYQRGVGAEKRNGVAWRICENRIQHRLTLGWCQDNVWYAEISAGIILRWKSAWASVKRNAENGRRNAARNT